MGATMLRSGFARELFCFLFLLIVTQAVPVAAAPGDVVVKLSQAKITVDENGEEVSGNADLSLPGDIIEYKAVYANKGKEAVSGLTAIMPVPVGMQFTGQLSPSGSYLASVDGKTFDTAPLMREVRQADGTMKKVPVPLSEYRALRLPLDELKVKESKTVTARMQIAPLIAPQEAAAP